MRAAAFPIPNDPIMAYLSAGRGVMIHRQKCGNLAEYRKQPDKWLSVAWEGTHGRLFSSEIQLEINNRVGVLAAVASSIAGTETNIDQVSLEERDVNSSSLKFQIQVRDRKHLALVIKTIRGMPDVLRVYRTAGMSKHIISTNNAPAAIGIYSQAVRVGNTIWVSGQIPLDPATKELVKGDMEAQVRQAFDNLKAIVVAAGASLDDVVKATVFLIDLSHFGLVNKIMAEYFHEPYPARAAVGVASLPRGAQVEVECIVAT